MKSTPSEPWFKPKEFGYGASPSGWQGWLSVAVFVAALVVALTCFAGRGRWVAEALSIAAFVALVYFKSSDKWRWRWGGR
jgi:hypothetical protein